MQQSNIAYGHPSSSSSINYAYNNNMYHYAPAPHLVLVDGVWHRMPLQYYGHSYFPPLFYVPPSSPYNDFDYRNATFLDNDITGNETSPTKANGLRRVPVAKITEDDLAFLTSSDKELFNLDKNVSCVISSSSSHSISRNSPIFLSPSPSYDQFQRMPMKSEYGPINGKQFPGKPSPLIRRTYRKSCHLLNREHLPKVYVPRSRKQPPPLRIPSLDVSQEFVGFCGALKVNPYYAECTGRITTTKDDIGHTYFVCANCGTRRRFLNEPPNNDDVLQLD